MGSSGTSGRSATRPTATTTTGRDQPVNRRAGGPSPRPGEPGSLDTGMSAAPAAPGEVAKQHEERQPQVEPVLDGATGRQAVSGGRQRAWREKLVAGGEKRR